MSKSVKNILVVSIIAIAIVLTSLIALTSCATTPNKGDTTGTQEAEKVRDIYAITAVSGVSLLADSFRNNTPSSVAMTDIDSSDTLARPDGISDDDTARIKQYLGMFEGYLLNNGITPEVTKPSEADGEYSSYQVKLTINLPNAGGTTDKYVMFCDEIDNADTNVANASEINDRDRDDNDDDDNDINDNDIDDDDKDETEIKSGIKGVMIYADNVYPLIGEKEVEIEDGESESELSLRVYMSETVRDTYIDIKQEIENDEMEYVYSVYDNGTLINKTKVEFENDIEDNEQEIKLAFYDNNSGQISKTWYKIEKSENKNIFNVKYNAGDGNVYKLNIKVDSDTYTFEYRNGFTEVI